MPSYYDPTGPLSIVGALSGATILLTGATGFLGKIVLEKILRSIPDVRMVYVLVRPRKGSSADERMQSEIISSEVFNRLKSDIGVPAFQELVKNKVRALPGELTLAEIGLTPELLQELYPTLNYILHSAAIVDFNERLDRAVELNVLGSLRLLEIAKRCREMRGFVHVSTAYVNSNRKGWLEEKLYPLGYDPDEMLLKVREMKESELDKIAGSGLLQEWPNTYTFTKAMTEHLLEKRREHVPLIIVRPSIIGSSWREPCPGWVDCLTAAGAVYMSCGLGILTLMPGQMDCVSDLVPADYVVNAMLAATAVIKDKKNTFSIMHATSTTENTMHWGEIMEVVMDFFRLHPPARRLAPPSFSMVPSAQLFQLLFFIKYSIPSAVLNTLTPLSTKAYAEKAALYNKLVWRARVIIESFRHFTENQWSFHNGRTRMVHQLLLPAERDSFNLSLKGLDWLDFNWNFSYGLCKYVLRMDLIELEPDDLPTGQIRKVHYELNKWKYYRPAPQLKQISAAGHGNDTFIAQQLERFPPSLPGDMSWSPSLHQASQRLFVDIHWHHKLLNQRSKITFGHLQRSKTEMMNLILQHQDLHRCFNEIIEKGGVNLGNGQNTNMNGVPTVAEAKPTTPIKQSYLESRARSIIEKMIGETNISVLSTLGYAFRKLWRKIYESVQIEKDGVEALQELVKKNSKSSFVYIPTHRSYIDFLIISYIAFSMQLPLPYIAAGEDFLGILLVRWIFRHSGAFFIRRSFLEGNSNSVDGYLYYRIFELYLKTLLSDGQSLEFYIEGTRSRSGKMLHPKTGMLSIITELCMSKTGGATTAATGTTSAAAAASSPASSSSTPALNPRDIYFVPISINYEKTIEGDLYSNELLGENKIKENFKNLLKSSSSFVGGNVNFGTISVVIRKAINLEDYMKKYVKDVLPGEMARTAAGGNNTTGSTGIPSLSTIVVKSNPTAVVDGSSIGSSSSSSSSSSTLIPLAYRKHFNLTLAYDIIYEMQLATEIMPTHLVSTLMLMYRQGITRQQLVMKVEWLRKEILRRGGELNNFATNDRTDVVTKAISFLSHVIIQRRSEIYEPAINTRGEYKNMLILGHYRNKIVHLFFKEGIVACALYALMEKEGGGVNTTAAAAQPSSSSSAASSSSSASTGAGVSRAALLTEVRFLFNLLQREFIYTNQIPDRIDSERVSELVLDSMIASGIFRVTNQGSIDPLIEVAITGETHFSFLCALIWPFIDSYYVSAMVLFSLQPNKKMEEHQLLQRTQWLATTLYHESMLCFYESCSMDTLRNTFDLYQKWSIIRYEKHRPKIVIGPGLAPPPVAGVKTNVSLLPQYQDEQALQALISKINFLRKPPPVKRNTSVRRNLIADLPMMAKL